MRRFSDIILAFFLSLATASAQDARTLPKLAADPLISVSKLPNGVSCYLAQDKSSKGIFDLSLVQKADAQTAVEDLSEKAGKRFSSIVFGSVTLDEFLARNGILPTEKGYISCRRGSVSYDFRNFASPRGEAALDTLLLSLFNLAQKAAEEGQPSSSQAVMISGDFDKEKLLSKMKTLCLINPFVPGQIEAPAYEKITNVHSDIRVEGGALARVSVRWPMAGTPPEYMATVLPVISGKLSAELGRLVVGRLYPAYKAAGQDVWIDLNNADAFSDCGNESMELTVNCYGRDRLKVKKILEEQLNLLYTQGVDATEYAYVRDANKNAWIARSKELRPDLSAALERCKAAFLYEASLSTDAERIRFAYRNVPDSIHTRFFNSYMRGVVGQTAVEDSVMSMGSRFAGRDAISGLLSPYDGKSPLKAPKDKEEYVTGGVIWTFSNGINVIYKKMDTRGMIYYSYASKGGRQYAREDNFKTIDGVSEDEFSSFLASEGIEMETILNPADVRLQGRVLSEKLSTMLKVLSALSNKSGNEKVFGNDCYKFLVMAGDEDQDKIKKILRDHVSSLGLGSRWKAVKYTDELTGDFLNERHYVMFESVFPFDVTAYNYAVAAVAYYALRDRLAMEFSDCAVSFLQEQGYVGFPLNSYRIRYGVRNVSTDFFSSCRTRLGEDKAQRRINDVISRLASEDISPETLAVYKKLAANEFSSLRNLPQYHIQSAMDRYLNNKDLLSRFDVQVNTVTAESVRSFYVAASSSDR